MSKEKLDKEIEENPGFGSYLKNQGVYPKDVTDVTDTEPELVPDTGLNEDITDDNEE